MCGVESPEDRQADGRRLTGGATRGRIRQADGATRAAGAGVGRRPAGVGGRGNGPLGDSGPGIMEAGLAAALVEEDHQEKHQHGISAVFRVHRRGAMARETLRAMAMDTAVKAQGVVKVWSFSPLGVRLSQVIRYM
jgi:hypothetical protein